MNNQKLLKGPMYCYTCQSETDQRCSYCLLPICFEHGNHMQPWFTSRMVMVCTPCQAKLEEIARQEQILQWTPKTQPRTAVLHV